MLIKTITIINNGYSPDDKKYIYNIRIKDIEFCCDNMRRVWEDDVRGEEEAKDDIIGFGEVEYKDGENTNNDVYIYHERKLYEGSDWEYYPIKYCPFCAEEIKIENVETITLLNAIS